MVMSKAEILEEKLFDDIISQRYLTYALSTIMSRSLPDVRDGLKPVHRRILYNMMLLKLNPNTPHKKSARVVGDVIGKFHPHGDQAVYDSMVRLAQDFTVRYPLIDGQGNFGSIDGDNAAAMRYTESKLTKIALFLLKDIDEDTVAFKPNYDGHEVEPTVLPARFPNLLANGSEGIAVGMATSIPPHNLDELCQALILLNSNSDTSIEEIMHVVQGPDFPTGGTIIESKETILENYRVGKGSFRVRAKWHVEHLNHGLYQIIITEIPYQVQKSKLVEKIAELYRDRKLPLLNNIRDESTDDIRLILEPKNRTTEPELLMETLFKLTDLEIKVSLNLNVINQEGIPKVLNIKEVLSEFLSHRDQVILNRSNFRLNKINSRLEILDGYIIAYLNIDEVINIIRYEDEPKNLLMQKFNLTDNQTEAILNMKLRSLRKLEEIEIKKEYDQLSKEKEEVISIIENVDKRKKVIESEIKEIKKEFGYGTEIGNRRTNFDIVEVPTSISIDAFIEKEPITVICSEQGWIRAMKGHNIEASEIKYKEGDKEKFIIQTYNTNKLIIISSNGKFYTISCNDLQKGKGHGESIKMMVDFEDNDDICNLLIYEGNRTFILASTDGKSFLISEEDVIAQTRSGKKIINLKDGEKLLISKVVHGEYCAVIGTNRKLLIFKTNEIPKMKKGQGVILQKYKDAKLADVHTFSEEQGLCWKIGDKTRQEKNIAQWLGKRGHAGKLPPVGFPRSNKFN